MTCSVDGCVRPARSRGWCHAHYTRWRKHGTPHHGGPLRAEYVHHGDPVLALVRQLRFMPSGCIEFAGRLTAEGYGRVSVTGSMTYAHRFSYELTRGPIPEGFHVDHLCHNRACVNPGHLEPVTPRENNRRSASPTAVNSTKRQCVHGHEFDDGNTYWWNGRRCCRTCRAESQRNRRMREAGR